MNVDKKRIYETLHKFFLLKNIFFYSLKLFIPKFLV